MSKKQNNTVVTETAPRRGRGRPASFPGKEMAQLISSIPVETRDKLRELAAQKGENINVTLERIIARGHRDANRSRSKKEVTAEV